MGISEIKDAAINTANAAKNKALETAEAAKETVLNHLPEMPEDTGFNKPDEYRDGWMLKGPLAKCGYDWWWHSFTGYSEKTGEEKSFYIEFFTVNPGLGGKEPLFDPLPSYLMVNVGAWGEDAAQLHRYFGWEEVNLTHEVPYLVSAGECFCSETRTMGKVEVSEAERDAHPEWKSDNGRMIWDLSIEKDIAFNVGYGAGTALREAEAFQMYWHAQGMKSYFKGTVIWNGETYKVRPEDCYGYADKNWGSDFTSPWIWLSSNDLKSRITGNRLKNSVFDIGGGRPKVGPLALEGKLLSAVWYEGTPYEFNFSKVWTLTRTKFKCKETKKRLVWRVVQETPFAKLMVQITCEKKDMLRIRYVSPDGAFRHKNLWNGGTGTGLIKLYKKKISLKNKWEWELVDEIEAAHVGCEYGVYSEKDEE